jgi:hypothetical protein
MVVAEDPDNKDRRILAPTKSNLGPRTTSLAYRIEAEDETPRVVWDGTSEHLAETLLTQTSAEERSQRVTAKEFLLEVLGGGEPVDSAKLLTQAEAVDIKRGTLWRAKKELGVIGRKVGFNAGWTWELPKNAQ